MRKCGGASRVPEVGWNVSLSSVGGAKHIWCRNKQSREDRRLYLGLTSQRTDKLDTYIFENLKISIVEFSKSFDVLFLIFFQMAANDSPVSINSEFHH